MERLIHGDELGSALVVSDARMGAPSASDDLELGYRTNLVNHEQRAGRHRHQPLPVPQQPAPPTTDPKFQDQLLDQLLERLAQITGTVLA